MSFVAFGFAVAFAVVVVAFAAAFAVALAVAVACAVVEVVAVAVEAVAVETVAVAVFALSLLFVQLGLLRLECAPSDVPCRVAFLYSPFFSPSILHHSINRLNSGRSRRVPQERGIAQHVLVPRSLKDAGAATPQ